MKLTRKWRGLDSAPSDTPLTDAKVKEIGLDSPFVHADFARTLERQLSAVKIRREEWERLNPTGGAAAMLEAMAERVRAGEPFHEVLEDFNMAPLEKASEAQQKAIEECVAIANRLKPVPGKYGWPHPTEAHDIELALRSLLKEKP